MIAGNSKPLGKVLIAYSSRPPILDYLAGAFGRMGIETCLVRADENTWFDRYVIRRINKLAHSSRLLPKSRDLFMEHPLAHRNYRSAKLLAAKQSFAPDLVLIIRGINFRPDVIAAMQPAFGWWVEHEGRVKEALAELNAYNGYFFINESCLQAARDKGFENVAYLAHAVDPHAFHPMADVAQRYDACFVGNWSRKRQEFLEEALRVSNNIALYGGKWLQKCWNRPAILKCWKGSYIEGAALNKLYNESRVVFNITNWGRGEGKARSGMNMRVLEVPASGAFLLTDESLEMENFLTPGQDVAIFDGTDDFRNKFRHFLDHPKEREGIANAGCERVRKQHTYDQVAGEIAASYGKWVAA